MKRRSTSTAAACPALTAACGRAGPVEDVLRQPGVSGYHVNAPHGAVIIVAPVVTRLATGKVQE